MLKPVETVRSFILSHSIPVISLLVIICLLLLYLIIRKGRRIYAARREKEKIYSNLVNQIESKKE